MERTTKLIKNQLIKGWFLTDEEMKDLDAKIFVCPTCIERNKLSILSKKDNRKSRVKKVKDLRKLKYSIRDIANLVGYKSPKSVQDILDQE
jgi:hypothetical protein